MRRRIGERRPDLHFFVVSNPEFLSQGTAVRDTFNADRIVIGADDEQAYKTVEEMYAPLELPIVHVSVRSSEMIKYASNDFLALKISYINEIANFCEMVGADIEEVARGMGMDRRIGSNFLKAGIGYGGHSLPGELLPEGYKGAQFPERPRRSEAQDSKSDYRCQPRTAYKAY